MGNINATIFDKNRVFNISKNETITLTNKKEQINSNKNKN